MMYFCLTFLYKSDEMYTDENGVEVVEYQMEVDDEQYPLTTLTTFNSYMDLKPPEKSRKALPTPAKKDDSGSKCETNPEKEQS